MVGKDLLGGFHGKSHGDVLKDKFGFGEQCEYVFRFQYFVVHNQQIQFFITAHIGFPPME